MPPLGQLPASNPPPSKSPIRPAFAAGTENAAAARTAGTRRRKRAATDTLTLTLVDRRNCSHSRSGIKREQSPSRGTPFPRSRGYRASRVKRADEGADSSEVTAASPAAPGAPLDDDALIELSRSSASDHLARREPAIAAVLFAIVALGALPRSRRTAPLSMSALVVCVVCYTLASRVQFEFGGVFAIPTQPTFVAMWFLLPPRMLPVVVCGSLLLAQLPDLVRGRMPRRPARALRRLVVVLGRPCARPLSSPARTSRAGRRCPIYVAALGAQFVFDYRPTFFSCAPRSRSRRSTQLRSVLPAFAVDSLLAPLGLLAAFASYGHPWALLLVLPVLLLFSTFARERQRRIDNALELSTRVPRHGDAARRRDRGRRRVHRQSQP